MGSNSRSKQRLWASGRRTSRICLSSKVCSGPQNPRSRPHRQWIRRYRKTNWSWSRWTKSCSSSTTTMNKLSRTRRSCTQARDKAALKKMKQIEGQITTLEAQRSNLDAQMTTLDNLEMNKMMVDAVRTANTAAQAAMANSLNPDE